MIAFINGTIVVDTESQTALEDVRRFLETAPVIIGGEQDCEFFLSQPSGNNVYFDDEEYQTNVIITVYGRLRWVDMDEVVSEYQAFFDAVTKRFWVEFHNVEICDCYRTDVRRFNEIPE